MWHHPGHSPLTVSVLHTTARVPPSPWAHATLQFLEYFGPTNLHTMDRFIPYFSYRYIPRCNSLKSHSTPLINYRIYTKVSIMMYTQWFKTNTTIIWATLDWPQQYSTDSVHSHASRREPPHVHVLRRVNALVSLKMTPVPEPLPTQRALIRLLSGVSVTMGLEIGFFSKTPPTF